MLPAPTRSTAPPAAASRQPSRLSGIALHGSPTWYNPGPFNKAISGHAPLTLMTRNLCTSLRSQRADTISPSAPAKQRPYLHYIGFCRFLDTLILSVHSRCSAGQGIGSCAGRIFRVCRWHMLRARCYSRKMPCAGGSQRGAGHSLPGLGAQSGQRCGQACTGGPHRGDRPGGQGMPTQTASRPPFPALMQAPGPFPLIGPSA